MNMSIPPLSCAASYAPSMVSTYGSPKTCRLCGASFPSAKSDSCSQCGWENMGHKPKKKSGLLKLALLVGILGSLAGAGYYFQDAVMPQFEVVAKYFSSDNAPLQFSGSPAVMMQNAKALEGQNDAQLLRDALRPNNAESAAKLLELARRQPQEPTYEALLALALVNEKKPALAIDHFQKALGAGYNAHNVVTAYAVALAALNRPDEALAWASRAYVENPRNTENAKLFADLLIAKGAHWDALSVLAGSAKLVGGNTFRAEIVGMGFDTAGKGMSIAAAEGHYVLPIPSNKMDKVLYFSLDTNRDLSLISKTQLAESGLAYTSTGKTRTIKAEDGGQYKADIIVFEKIQVGPYALTEVEANVCERCDAVLGKGALDKLQIKEEGKSLSIMGLSNG